MARADLQRQAENILLSPNEERYVLAEMLTPQVYAIPWSYRIAGPLDLDRLEAAIWTVTACHDNLRAGFELVAAGSYRKYVEATPSCRLDRFEMPGADVAEVRAFVHSIFYEKPRLTPAALSRYLVIRISPGQYVFALSQHHAISDGQSMRLFIEQVFAILASDAVPSATPFDACADPDWLSLPAYDEARRWWCAGLNDIDEIIGVAADLGNAGASRDDSVTLDLPPAFADLVASTARRIGVSRFAVFYAACAVLLARMTDGEAVPTTFQSGGRATMPHVANAIGSFSNALVLVPRVDPAMSFSALARAIGAGMADAVAHEAMPYHHVIKATGVHPKFGINWFPRMPLLSVPGLSIGDGDVSDSESDYDLNFRFVPHPGRIELVLFYKARAISRQRASAVADRYLQLAAALFADPDATIASTRSRDIAGDRIPDISAPLAKAATGGLVHHAFLTIAAAHPERIALRFENQSTTYGELATTSEAVAIALAEAGIDAGQRVAILAARTPALVATILGIARRGAVFIAVDAAYPEQRLQALLAACRPDAIINVAGKDHDAMLQTLASKSGAAIVLTGRAPKAQFGGEASANDLAVSPDAPAYLLFTSGSTGEPKCIACSHIPLVHFVGWQAETYGLTADDRFTMLSGLSHDPLLRDIFTPLSIGAALHIPSQSMILEPGALYRWFAAERPTVAHLTPPMGQLLADAPARGHLNTLRRVFWGGDLLRPALLDTIDALAPNVRHSNFYGSTETPQAAANFDVDVRQDWRTVPIGRGTEGFQLAVLDRHGDQKGLDEVGEIAVRSRYLGLGYFRDGEIVRDSEAATDGAATYHTGDRGFHLPDGNIALLGRADDQIKVRGYRIELSEVTAALLRHPAVSEGIALAVGDDRNRRIEAFAVDDLPSATRQRKLMAFLAEQLPTYMMPQQVHQLARLPLLPNGKTDRRALLALSAEAAQRTRPADRLDGTETAIAEAWSKLLNGAAVRRDSTFVELGGDSLTYVQAFLSTEDVIGTVPDDWQFMTVAELAGSATGKSSGWRKIESTMLIRAISIFLVVSAHFKFLPYLSGVTTALFMISGHVFGEFQLSVVFLLKLPSQ